MRVAQSQQNQQTYNALTRSSNHGGQISDNIVFSSFPPFTDPFLTTVHCTVQSLLSGSVYVKTKCNLR